MANLTENRLDTILTEAVLTTITENLNEINGALPIGTLTDDQRDSYAAIDVDNKIFVEDTLTEMAISSDGIIPPFLKRENIEKDFIFFEQLDAIESKLRNTLRKVTDLKRICGSEAYDVSLSVYRIYESASRAGIPNAKESHDKLKIRFQKMNGNSGRPPAEDL